MIKVEIEHPQDENFTSLVFTSSNLEADRDNLDEILKLVCDTGALRRGGYVKGNVLMIDVKSE
jgi:hypothetical protein